MMFSDNTPSTSHVISIFAVAVGVALRIEDFGLFGSSSFSASNSNCTRSPSSSSLGLTSADHRKHFN
ncbi:hypothetical protein F0562_022302 [Nyssa sinensis]|uniref:Uncharacterized protein n=1 Tax=Nyssa sinensis TaxID=561372 RepID=A0A5J5BQA0_9ASTE|nr:hypothetical protein F0562_022302 [Nyssa sinensis]